MESTKTSPILTKDQKSVLHHMAHLFPLDQLVFDTRKKEEYMVDFCFSCARLEGNGYNRVDADCLLRFGITKGDNLFTDANELICLKKIFNLIVQKRSPLNLDLVLGLRRMLQPAQDEIGDQGIQLLLDQSSQYEDPFEKAIFLHCNFAARQFFGDSSLQMARILQTASLVQSGVMPLFFNESLFEEYKSSTNRFSSSGDYGPYADFFVKNYLQSVSDHTGMNQHDLLDGSGSLSFN